MLKAYTIETLRWLVYIVSYNVNAYTIETLRWLVYIVSYNVKCIHYRNSEMAGIYCFLHEFSLYMNFYGTSLGDFTNRACGHSFHGLLACCS